MSERTPAEAALLGWRLARAVALFEALLAALPAALFIAVVGRIESGASVAPVAVLCGVLVGTAVAVERWPERLASLARLDRGLGLGGALEVAVALEQQAGVAPRFRAAVEARLAGRLPTLRIARMAAAMRPAPALAAGLVALVLFGVLREETQQRPDAALEKLLAGRVEVSTRLRAKARDTEDMQPRTEAREATRTPKSSAADARRPASASGPEPAQAATGGGEPGSSEATGESQWVPAGGSKLISDAARTSKLAPGASSGVTREPRAGKIAPGYVPPSGGAWWPARHDAVVRAWLNSIDGPEER